MNHLNAPFRLRNKAEALSQLLLSHPEGNAAWLCGKAERKARTVHNAVGRWHDEPPRAGLARGSEKGNGHSEAAHLSGSFQSNR